MSQGRRLKAVPPASARASASSWFTVWVARTLERPICCSECLRSCSLEPSRRARSACMRRPASGVLSWWAASARKRFCVPIDSFRRVSRSLTEDTSGATSSGTVFSSSGLRSSGRRARMRSSSWLSGLMPRTNAIQTSSTASGSVTNCGSMTPLMISVASTLRFSRVSATWTSAGCPAGTGNLTQMDATRTSRPRSSSSRRWTSPGTAGRSSSVGRGRSRSPLRSSPRAPSTW